MFQGQQGTIGLGLYNLSCKCCISKFLYIFLFFFSDVYSLCVAHPEPLADKLYQETRNFLDNHVKQLHETVKAQGNQENIGLLKAYYTAWKEYSQGIIYLHRLYL